LFVLVVVVIVVLATTTTTTPKATPVGNYSFGGERVVVDNSDILLVVLFSLREE